MRSSTLHLIGWRPVARVWDVEFVGSLRGNWGICCPAERVIKINQQCEEFGRLREIVIHELLHAVFDFLSEDSVHHAAVAVDHALQHRSPGTHRRATVASTLLAMFPCLDSQVVHEAGRVLARALSELGIDD